jgi:hypothetical protein
MTDFRFLVPVLCASAVSMAPATAVVADSSALDDWQFKAGLYLYAAGVKGETATGGDLDISFTDLISNLNMAFMGDAEARRDKWSLAADVIYLNVGAGGGGRIPIESAPGVSVKVDADVKLRAWVLGFTGGYRVLQSERANLDVIAGARYLEISSFLNTSSRLGPLARTRELAASGTNWDAIVGVKGEVNLQDNWYAPYYLDVGTGDSDLTWQIAGGVGYKFDWGDAYLLYRHMDWDFKSGSKLDDLNLSGPQLGVNFSF